MAKSDNFGHESYVMQVALDIFNDAGIWQYEMQLDTDEDTGELIAHGKWDDSFRDAVMLDLFSMEKPDKDGNFYGEATHEDVFYFLLDMYVSFYWHFDDNHLKLITLKSFAEFSERRMKTPLSFNEIKSLIKKHWRKPSVTGLTEKNINLFPKTAGNYYKLVVEDYIAMMHELEIPVINEEKIHDIKNRGMAFQDFWWLYCSMAKNLETRHWRDDLFTIGLDRFMEKVDDNPETLWPMLSILFDHYAENKDWAKEMMGENDGKGSSLSSIGYSSMMFGRRMLYPEELMDNTLKYRNDDNRQWELVVAWEYLKRRWVKYIDLQDTKEGTFDNFGSYILATWNDDHDNPQKQFNAKNRQSI